MPGDDVRILVPYQFTRIEWMVPTEVYPANARQWLGWSMAAYFLDREDSASCVVIGHSTTSCHISFPYRVEDFLVWRIFS